MENEEEKDKDKLREERLEELLGEDVKTQEELDKEIWLSEKSEFICANKWCKVKYQIERFEFYENGKKTCQKCQSFDNELSGGTSFSKKEYSGPRHDGNPHPVDFKFSDYSKGKWGKFWGK